MSALGGGLWRRLDERGLKLVLFAFFFALAIPAVALVAQAYSQLKWQAFRSAQLGAEELAGRIDSGLRTATAAEEARSFGDYSFLVVAGDAAANFVQRSPLSAFPVASAVPGVLGYFQVDADGRFSTPLLPEQGIDAERYGIAAPERAARAARADALKQVLTENRLVRPARDEIPAASGGLARVQRPPEEEPAAAKTETSELDQSLVSRGNEVSVAAVLEPLVEARAAPAATPPAAVESKDDAPQAGFDRLVGGAFSARAPAAPVAQAASKEQDAGAQEAKARSDETLRDDATRLRVAPERQKRVEQALVPEAEAVVPEPGARGAGQPLELRVRTFESELDPFELGALDTGQLVLFRNVWRDGRRSVQGALIDRAAFLAGVVEQPYRASSVAALGNLGVTFQGHTLATLPAAGAARYSAAPSELAGALLHRVRLSPPFGDLELVFDVSTLPRAPGAALLAWVSLTLAVVLSGGFLLMYRFATGQMRLARQQQDFVSAVSHELKTPLTSIRMYGEMLKAGWVDEAKRQTYYDYIHGESERLSRLIENVLRLARLTRSAQRFDLKAATVAELLDMVRSKVGTQVERAGFALRVRDDASPDATLVVDGDCFAQIFINLVDNALKFAASAADKTVEIACRRESDGALLFTVRDFGPGVPKEQMKKIFELFYRAENELTRETVGTGIGLALVRQLAAAMGGRVDVRNCEPGAEFRLHFKPT
jgi:signal transduction histidine kinase